MAYVTEASVQKWLENHKYNIAGIDDELVETAIDVAFSLLTRRYDTTTWIDSSSTPRIVLKILNMLVASYTLRRSISADDGVANYADWLEKRALELLAGLAGGQLEIPGVDPDPGATATEGLEFWPTQDATDLWFEEGDVEGAAALAFTMQKEF
jgi:hypothetical protein